MTPGRFVARAAALAALLMFAGCAAGPEPLLGLFGQGTDANARTEAAAMLTLTSDGAADGDGGVPAPETAAAPVEPVVQVAALPAIGGPREPKPAKARAPSCNVPAPGGRSSGTIESDGQRFAVECFRAKTDKPGPAVLILHGAAGIGRNTVYDRLAEMLTERGYSAFILEYLRPISTPAPAKPKAAPQVVRGQSQAKADSIRSAARVRQPRARLMDNEAQAKAIEDAITSIQALSYVDQGGIGLFGLSLGGFHALAIAAHDTRVKAVVNMFGAMPRQSAPGVYRMPPTLILHGDRDNIVPVKRAHELARLLKEIGATYELKVYKGQGHTFRDAADQDSLERSTQFLFRWLGGKPGFDGAKVDDKAG
jgi:dienelactone hydrolase